VTRLLDPWFGQDDFDLKTKTNDKTKPKCIMFGKEIQDQQPIVKETIEDTQIRFDTLSCSTLFKKLNSV
jgi:hypothetical protein